MLEGIDNVGLCVTDLSRAVAFYQRLGFTKAFENERGVTMAAGSAKLFLFRTRCPGDGAADREFSLFENPPGLDHISFLVNDVDAFVTYINAA